MSRRLLNVLADFLDLLADSSEPVEIGQVGPPDSYTSRESKAIGAAVLGLAGKLIGRADARSSCRRTRHGAIVRCWLPLCRESCRQQAAALRLKAAGLDDDGNDKKQGLLF